MYFIFLGKNYDIHDPFPCLKLFFNCHLYSYNLRFSKSTQYYHNKTKKALKQKSFQHENVCERFRGQASRKLT